MTDKPKFWFNTELDIAVQLEELGRQIHADQSAQNLELRDVWGISTSMTQMIVAQRVVFQAEWLWFFARVAAGAINIMGDHFKLEEFTKMLIGKHQKYGVSSLTRWREIGVASRIDQKLARAQNLIITAHRNPDTITNQDIQKMIFNLGTRDETLYDTIADVLGYCVLGHYLSTNPVGQQ